MKRILSASVALASLSFAGTALAADIAAAPMPAPMPPPMYNWTGFYIGGNVGGGWDHLKATELPPGSVSFPAGTAFATNNLEWRTRRRAGWLQLAACQTTTLSSALKANILGRT